jgi:hypothetical protein
MVLRHTAAASPLRFADLAVRFTVLHRRAA